MRQSKMDQIRAAWAAGDELGALKIASKFIDRSDDTRLFNQGYGAHLRPEFYRQIGRDPAAMTEAAIVALARKFKLPRQG